MSPTLGGRRSPDAWSSLHDRARARLAERMTEPLEPEESAWLEAHLAGCEACREIDAAYQSDRAQLRGMRVIPPPRDLWARTSAALDQEQGRAGSGRRSRPARRRSETPLLSFPRGRWAPVGALGSIAAVMVVGFLVGNAIIGNGPASSPSQGVALGSSATPNLVPTPRAVPGGADVAWVSTDSDGSIVLKQAPVTGVCPPDKPTGCTPFDADASNVVTLPVKPKSVHQSPTSGQMIVFGEGQGGSGVTIYLINTGKSTTPTPTPAATATTPATSAPPATPVTSTGTPATGSGGPPPSTGGPSPSTGGPSPTTGGPPPSESPVDSTPPATASPTPKPSLTASIVPNVTPPPSAATLIAIASNVDVLSAETSAYSPDGAWFAFTARAHGDPSGSDIYLWHAGDAQATQVTRDGRSVFAGWVGNRLIGSRATRTPTLSDSTPSAAPATDGAVSAGADLGAISFIFDPASRTKTLIPTAAWRPAVDPTGKFVVYWEGTVALDPDTGGWRTATGRLVIRAWPIVAGTAPTPSAAPSVAPAPASVAPTASPSASAGSSAAASSSASQKATKKPTASPSTSPATSVAPSPSSSPSVPASPSPSPVASSGLPASIASASGVDWAVAWDETGTHVALWIGDSGDRSFGRLSLLTIGANGLPVANGALVTARPALPGFALSDGHLAWATPPGMNADGSRLTILDYSGADSGERTGSGQPGADTVIVVQH